MLNPGISSFFRTSMLCQHEFHLIMHYYQWCESWNIQLFFCYVFQPALEAAQYKLAFTNYIDKERWVDTQSKNIDLLSMFIGQKMSIQGGKWSKKAKNLSTQFVYDSLDALDRTLIFVPIFVLIFCLFNTFLLKVN